MAGGMREAGWGIGGRVARELRSRNLRPRVLQALGVSCQRAELLRGLRETEVLFNKNASVTPFSYFGGVENVKDFRDIRNNFPWINLEICFAGVFAYNYVKVFFFNNF